LGFWVFALFFCYGGVMAINIPRFELNLKFEKDKKEGK
jgi:hypothetical protein